jgi:hypothetical protein
MPEGRLQEITSTIPNGQVGVTTVGEVRALGGKLVGSGSVGSFLRERRSLAWESASRAR